MLAHIRSGNLIKQYPTGTGWVILEDGRRTSPPVAGFVDGNDKVVPMVQEENDTSTGPNVIRTDTGWQVEADRVYRLITIRDKTQAELDAAADAEVTEDLERKTGKAIFRLANEIQALKGQPDLTVAQFKNWWKQL